MLRHTFEYIVDVLELVLCSKWKMNSQLKTVKCRKIVHGWVALVGVVVWIWKIYKNYCILEVLLIWLVRALSRRLVFFNRTTSTMDVKISRKAPNIPNTVPRKGFIWWNVGANADGSSSRKSNQNRNCQSLHAQSSRIKTHQFVSLDASQWKLVKPPDLIFLFYCEQQQQHHNPNQARDF